MKKIILMLALVSLGTQALAIDYAYEAVRAYRSCITSKSRCEEAKRYVNEGINFYANKRTDSYENLKNYCSLLYLRANARSWGNMEQWQRDMFNYQRSCNF